MTDPCKQYNVGDRVLIRKDEPTTEELLEHDLDGFATWSSIERSFAGQIVTISQIIGSGSDKWYRIEEQASAAFIDVDIECLVSDQMSAKTSLDEYLE